MNLKTIASRTAASALVVAAIAAGLSGCSSSGDATSNAPGTPPSSSAAPSANHNQADITFATNMIPHHAQAVEMSRMATSHASSPQVKDLASRIESAQQPEIDQMSAFLRSWNAPVPDPSGSMPGMNRGGDMGNMPGMAHGNGSGNMSGMSGMMSESQMRELGAAHSAAFDTMFLKMMISHHEGATSMAQTELKEGQNADAEALARRIIDAQQREITEMKTLLGN